MSSVGLNISSLGINSSTASSGSGIDVTAVVDQILYADRAPERIWQAQQATLTLQTTAWTGIASALSSLSDQANALKDSLGALTGKTVTSSDSSMLSATADSSAASGTHVIAVQNLATTSSYYADPLPSSSSTLTPGSLALTVGSGSPTAIPVDDADGTTTISGLVNYINSHSFGVTASIVNDASGARLALVSNTSGSAGDLTVSTDVPELNFTKAVKGANASLTIDGVPVSSASNNVTGAVPGLTLNLLAAAPLSPAQITVAADTQSAQNAVNSFVSSYNAVVGQINQQYTVNTSTNSEGPLAGDVTLRNLQSALLNDATYTVSGNNGITGLASIGVNMNNDGTLTVDSTKLTSVLQNQFSDFQNFFQSLDSSNQGFAYHLSTDLMAWNDPSTGPIALDEQGITSTQTMLTSSINDLESRLTTQQQFLIDEYSRVDTALRQYPLIMAQLTSQLASIPVTSK
jgi:flagellar hook-associated protein 2